MNYNLRRYMSGAKIQIDKDSASVMISGQQVQVDEAGGLLTRSTRPMLHRSILVFRLGEMRIQSCGQRVSAPRGIAGAWLNAHTEMRAKRQRSAREAMYQNRPISSSSSVYSARLYEHSHSR